MLALLLFGPKKLPEIGRTLAKAMNDFKSASNEFKSTLEAEVAKLEDETRIGETLDSIRHPIQNLVARGQAMLHEAITPDVARVNARASELVIEAAPIPADIAADHHLEAVTVPVGEPTPAVIASVSDEAAPAGHESVAALKGGDA